MYVLVHAETFWKKIQETVKKLFKGDRLILLGVPLVL